MCIARKRGRRMNLYRRRPSLMSSCTFPPSYLCRISKIGTCNCIRSGQYVCRISKIGTCTLDLVDVRAAGVGLRRSNGMCTPVEPTASLQQLQAGGDGRARSWSSVAGCAACMPVLLSRRLHFHRSAVRHLASLPRGSRAIWGMMFPKTGKGSYMLQGHLGDDVSLQGVLVQRRGRQVHAQYQEGHALHQIRAQRPATAVHRLACQMGL